LRRGIKNERSVEAVDVPLGDARYMLRLRLKQD
jgi:hypothetical protein